MSLELSGSEPEEYEGGPIRSSFKILRLSMPVDVRWNSTWYMLERVLRLVLSIKVTFSWVPGSLVVLHLCCKLLNCFVLCMKETCLKFPSELPELSQLDWFRLYAMYRLLEPYKVATKMLEAEKTITGSLTLQAFSRLPGRMDLFRFRDPYVGMFKTTIQECMCQEQDDPNWFLSCGIMLQLDPTKCQLSNPCFVRYYWDPERFPNINERYPSNSSWIDDVHAACVEEMNSIACRGSEVEDGIDGDEADGEVPVVPMVPSTDEDWLTSGGEGTPAVILENLNDEYNRFSATRNLAWNQNTKKESPEDWWKRNLGSFPNVAKLAAEYLCIPSSSAAVERMFSSNGHTLNKRRRLMSSEKVHQVTFVRDNIDLVPDIV